MSQALTTTTAPSEVIDAEQGTSLWRDAWYRLKRNRLAIFGLAVIALVFNHDVHGRIDFYQARGQLQLYMSGIDPEYTLGKLAAERERLVRALASEGLLRRNASVAMPLVPLRVGLVTSANSARIHSDRRRVSTSTVM